LTDSLNPRARAFLRSVQDADEPTLADRNRVRGRVKAQLAAGVAAGVAALVSSKAAVATAQTAATASAGAAVSTAPATIAAAGTGLGLTKIVSALMVVAAVAGGTTAIVRHVQQPPVDSPTPGASPQTVTAPLPRPLAAAPRQVPSIPAVASAATPLAPAAPRVDPAAAPTPMGLQAARAEPTLIAAPAAPAPPIAPAGSAPSVDDEIALVRDARAALRGGDAPRALALLDAHDHLFPGGVLGEDCAAERVYALCALRRTEEARAAASRFLAEHPVSPHATSVRASCGVTSAAPTN
jgi:hypothetical protein